jgi:hypothetical protein
MAVPVALAVAALVGGHAAFGGYAVETGSEQRFAELLRDIPVEDSQLLAAASGVGPLLCSLDEAGARRFVADLAALAAEGRAATRGDRLALPRALAARRHLAARVTAFVEHARRALPECCNELREELAHVMEVAGNVIYNVGQDLDCARDSLAA